MERQNCSVRGFADALGHSDGMGELGRHFLDFDESLIVCGGIGIRVNDMGWKI
tara:strand:+ start:1484 stop:1642 length:159 start_codon:yes stop_codon:yes gene_type:complete